jgi:hypothetical protein
MIIFLKVYEMGYSDRLMNWIMGRKEEYRDGDLIHLRNLGLWGRYLGASGDCRDEWVIK